MKHLKHHYFIFLFISSLIFNFCTQQTKDPATEKQTAKDSAFLVYPNENHLANIRQLTRGGDNAEAYFSSEGKKIVFQARNKSEGRKTRKRNGTSMITKNS